MNLLVDIGNTRLKWLLIDPGWLLIDPGRMLVGSGGLLIDPGPSSVAAGEALNTSEKNIPSPHDSGERARVRGPYTGSTISPPPCKPGKETIQSIPGHALSGAPSLSLGGALLHGPDFMQQLDDAWSHLTVPHRVVVANVAGAEARQGLQSWVQRHWPAARLHFVVAVAAQLGVKNGYREPAQLGSDRWAALIGARQRVTGAVCVVDCGTAITLDALDAAGEFAGGVILPGITLARDALRARAPGIAAAEGDDSSCFARSTAAGVAAGTLYGAAGAMERIVAEFGARLGKDMHVLLTGGDAPRLRPLLHGRWVGATEAVPDLVLQGLARIAESLT